MELDELADLFKIGSVLLKAFEENMDEYEEILGKFAKRYREKYMPWILDTQEAHFKGLIERGFTREEALALCLNANLHIIDTLKDMKLSSKKKKPKE